MQFYSLTANILITHYFSTTLEGILQFLHKDLSEEELNFTIRRDYVLQDAMREGRKSKFDPYKLLKVDVYINVCRYNITLLMHYKFHLYKSRLLAREPLTAEGLVGSSFGCWE